MRSYFVQITETAIKDIETIHNYIAYELFAPETADKYIKGVFDAINHLANYGGAVAVSQRESLLKKYGNTVRGINYKKMAIIYTLKNNTITVKRIIAGTLIL